jgi:UrcA family protein
MKYDVRNSRVLQLGLAAIGALLVNGALAAPQAEDEVVVESSRGTGLVHQSPYAPEKHVSITRHVSYADLDIATHSGALALESRIHENAQEICAKLNSAYGPTGFDQFRCVKDAVRGAMAQARVAIEAAEHRMRTASIEIGK